MTDGAPQGFYRLAEEDPDAPAVVDVDGSTTTRGELHARVNQVSHALLALGLAVDDRVAILVRNSVRYFDWMLAAGQIGVHPVPLNFHLRAKELAYIVQNSGSKVVAVGADLVTDAREALEQVGFDGARVALDKAAGSTAYADYLDGRPTSPPVERTNGSVMLYTAGTTGVPKGVLWPATPGVTPEMVVTASAPMFARRGITIGGVSLVCGPLYHGAPGAQGLQALHWGQSVVLVDKWDSERILALIERYGVTHAQMAPIHFHRLLQLPPEIRRRYDVSTLQAVIHAGAGCPVEIKRQMMDWFGPVLFEYYAASEGYATSISPQQWLAHPGSVGHISSDGAEVTIVGDDDAALPPGEVGTIYVRLPGLGTSEHLGEPEKTASMVRPDGFRTFGDMGYVDAAGWLYIVDRRVDMILTGGVNVYPAEVEARLRTHPDVADVAVIGVPDDEWGQTVRAIVVPRADVAGDEVLESELDLHCEAGLANSSAPVPTSSASSFRTQPLASCCVESCASRSGSDVRSGADRSVQCSASGLRSDLND